MNRDAVMDATVEVGPAHVMFLVLFLSTLFFLIVWVVGVVVRLKMPEPVLPVSAIPVMRRRVLTQRGEAVPVGIREIREDEQLRATERCMAEYEYIGLARGCVPEPWLRDLNERRN